MFADLFPPGVINASEALSDHLIGADLDANQAVIEESAVFVGPIEFGQPFYDFGFVSLIYRLNF